ncbi:hypothetical protein EST38_g1537 [Candolleomyces aberdarensis]|uniref:Uncharacterized protein n=1 Tax=Candolleomyces aberdarensis TaxID=2316362 RepID=A0A4Q2DWT8_9AGAR|nr:hypothetical protein EST38_g1537 [Candolleomyces aberdarensis]
MSGEQPRRFSQDLLNRLANALTPGSKKSTQANPTPPPSEPSIPSFSAPTSPYTMANELNDAITTPLSPTTWAAASAATPILHPESTQFGAELRRIDSTSSIASSLKRKIALSGLSVSEFFKKLGKGVANIGKSSKEDGGGSQSSEYYDYLSSTTTRNANELQTPPPTPPHQKLKQPLLPPNRAGPPHSSGLGHAKLLSMVAEGDENSDDSESAHQFPLPQQAQRADVPSGNDGSGEGGQVPPEDPTDPDYLAHRIQQLIDTLPPPPPTPRPQPHKPLPPGTPRPSRPWKPLPGSGEGKEREGGGGGAGLPPIGQKPITKPPKRDRTGKPIPPDNAVPPEIGGDGDDESTGALLRFLQSATVMNGGKTTEKPTVWEMLSRLGAPPHWGWDSEPLPPAEGEDGAGGGEGGSGERTGGGVGGDDARTAFADTHSVMMYSPLIPTKADIVELAEAVPVYFEEEVPYEEYAALSATTAAANNTQPKNDGENDGEGGVPGWSAVKTMWPLGAWFGAVQAQEAGTTTTATAANTNEVDATAPEIVVTPPSATPLSLPQSPYIGSPRMYQSPYLGNPRSPYMGSPQQLHSPYIGSPRMLHSPYLGSPRLLEDGELPPVEGALVDGEDGKKYRVRSQTAWVPSIEKVSYEVMWWGYRVYLPPPAMKILDDKTLEAQKRAALITSALTWFFNNIPVDMLPLPFQPTVMLLQRLAPYLGYIGTFIAWSWRSVKSYDIGHGVILSATWLLPIALIPGTWYEYSFPKSPAPPQPAPLPPVDNTPTSGAPTESTPSTPAPSVPPTPAPSTPAPTLPSSPTPEPAPTLPPTPNPEPIPEPSPETPVPPAPSLPPSGGEESPIEPPPTSPPAPIPLPPEDGDSDVLPDPPSSPPPSRKVPSSPKVPRSPKSPPSSPFPTPGSPLEEDKDRIGTRSSPGGGRPDKRGWGRFQVTRTFGAGSAGVQGQSFVVAPASSTPGSPFSSYSSEIGSATGSSTPTTWGTPLSSPLVRGVGLGAVQPGSPLMDELLKSRRVETVPLPSPTVTGSSNASSSAK